MLKDKQLELINNVIENLKSKFPNISLQRISYGNDDTWVYINVPDELVDDEEIETILGSKSTNIMLDYGYDILFYPLPLSKSIATNNNF
jgi:hypothetical protein